MRTIEHTAVDYEVLVRRNPSMPNREIAHRLGMSLPALVQALRRARKAGLLTIWRVSYGHQVEIARRGERDGRRA